MKILYIFTVFKYFYKKDDKIKDMSSGKYMDFLNDIIIGLTRLQASGHDREVKLKDIMEENEEGILCFDEVTFDDYVIDNEMRTIEESMNFINNILRDIKLFEEYIPEDEMGKFVTELFYLNNTLEYQKKEAEEIWRE